MIQDKFSSKNQSIYDEIEVFNSNELLSLNEIDNKFEILSKFANYEFKIATLNLLIETKEKKILSLEEKLDKIYRSRSYKLGLFLLTPFYRIIRFLWK